MPRLLLLAAALLALAAPARAQQDQATEADEAGGGRTQRAEQTLYDAFVADYKDEYLALGALLQGVADFRPEDDAQQGHRLLIAAARLRVSGTLDDRVGYLLQADFASDTPLLDARMSYRPSDAVRLAAGRYKAPFSAEVLTSAANIDFVNRSRVAQALAPGRAVGASAEVGAPGGGLSARAGVFNRSVDAAEVGGRSGDPVGRFLYVARLRGQTPAAARGGSAGVRLSVGANALYETSDGAPVDPAVGRVADRVVAGGDARLRVGPVLLAGEAIAELVDGPDGFEAGRSGYYVTVGADLAPAHRVLARVDGFRGDEDLLLGYNVSLSQAAGAQLNVGLPLDDDAPGRTRVLVNVQVAL